MRILQVHTRYRQPGGEDIVVAQERSLLEAAGHEVVAYTASNPTGALATVGALSQAAWNRRAASEVAALVAEVQPDVAHVHNTWFAASPSVLYALTAADVPVVCTLHNYRLLCLNASLFRDGGPCEDCVGNSVWRGVRHRCYRESAAASTVAAGVTMVHRALGTWQDRVRMWVVLNEFARDLFVRGGIAPEKLRIKANSTVDPGRRSRAPSQSNVAVCVGRLEPEKGVDTLVAAWSDAGDLGMELVMVGDGSLRSSLEASAPANVRFVGHQPREAVTELMLGARAMMFPTVLYEGQPLVILEALAAGLPIVASDVGGNAELLRPLGAEWLVPPGDRARWAGALKLLHQSGGLDAAGRLARDLYERQFTEESAVRSLEAIYHEVLA